MCNTKNSGLYDDLPGLVDNNKLANGEAHPNAGSELTRGESKVKAVPCVGWEHCGGEKEE